MLHFVMPAGIDDPSRPTGGNRYDRRLCDELRASGQPVAEHHVSSDRLERTLAELPNGALVLIDGLIATSAPDVLVPAAQRLRLGVLLHMLKEDEPEHAVLSAAGFVITTSHWGCNRAIERHGLSPTRVHVATPGADVARPVRGTPDGGALLCVAAVAAHKGQDVLLHALATLTDASWRVMFVGSLDRDPEYVNQLRQQTQAYGIADRVTFTGALGGAALIAAYTEADILVHPSRGEMYGLVITEALAHALPVIASDLGGVREALGCIDAGLLVPPDDAPALATALRTWLSSSELRATLRCAATERRATLPTWADTARAVTAVMRN